MVSSNVLFPNLEYPHLKGKPHWRRTLAVYAALDTAPPDATYPQLLALVEQLAEINRIKQEQAKQEQEAKNQQIQIETALARLEEAKVQYQSSLSSYQQSVERQRLELTSLRSQLAEVDSQLQGLGEVRSPYSGIVKKVKVKGQKEGLMEVEVTIVPENN